MKGKFFGVNGVISTACLIGVLSLSATGQEVEHNKMDKSYYNDSIIMAQELQKVIAEEEKKALKPQSVKKLTKVLAKEKSVSTLESEGIKESENKIEVSLLEREKEQSISTLKPEGIKQLETNIQGSLLDRKKEKPVSTLESEGIKETKTEITGTLMQEKSSKEVTSSTKPQSIKKLTRIVEQKKTYEKDDALLNYICQKEDQLTKLEKKFTAFQKTMEESTLSMQNAIAQLAMMNQNQIQRVPSVFDRYENMYPMMMMQQMQNQMYMQNMQYNNMQSMNMLMMSSMMNYGNYGQRSDAYAYGQNNLKNNYGYSYDQQRTNFVQPVQNYNYGASNIHWNPSKTSLGFDASQNIVANDVVNRSTASDKAPVLNEEVSNKELSSVGM